MVDIYFCWKGDPSEVIKLQSFIKWSNPSRVEKEGLKSLKEKLQPKEVVIFQTDKSGRFSVDIADNYKAACETYTTGDVEITEEKYNK